MTNPTAPPSADGAQPTPPPHRSDRFFSWVSGLGIARSEGWIGGVAAGTAARLRIDPLIVRGVLVVATLCGLPLILLYAIAWALLPDAEGRIHARSLLHGSYVPAQLGILAGVIVGLMTLSPLSYLGLLLRMTTGPYNGYDYGLGGPSALRVVTFFFGLALAVVLLVFIVRAARRALEAPATTPQQSAADPQQATAAMFAPVPSVPARDSAAAAETAEREPDALADAPDLESWRAQHTAWQQQDRAWRAQQQDADRLARDQARREREQAAAAFSAEAAERRRVRRASRPRAGFAFIATAIGFALVAGAVVWLWSQTPDAVTAAIALFSAALVLAFAMIIAGVARRRSGFLTFVTVATLVAGLVTGAAANSGDVRLGDAWVSNLGDSTIIQPFGALSVNVMPPQDGFASHPITIRKGTGSTEIMVQEGVELKLDARLGDGEVRWQRWPVDEDGASSDPLEGVFSPAAHVEGRAVYRETIIGPDTQMSEGTPEAFVTVPLTIDQESGDVIVTSYIPDAKESAE